MGKVFTITEGLENLGAMKTGGQGSVYKGKRIGEIITAIKLLPTPIYSESMEDKNFADFQNEVQKLKKVNEKPNPNVVKILSSGVSDTGNFPFIEMEFVEGPELEELIKPPHEPVFTIKEVLKVADQLSHALAHCHKVEVRHGDVKSNNVKFNIHTGNYVLLDFGLAVMSDEQRRTSLRHAGAIEFMAPEQNEGQMLFQTDVYSFGIVLFELLAGEVPFPLNDKGETARNAVRLSHMETPPPDLIATRRKNLPATWSDDKKEHEMHVPEWLVTMIYKCLEKKPVDRFATGIELNEYIMFNSTLAAKKEEDSVEETGTLKEENTKLLLEKGQLLQGVTRYRQEAIEREKELQELKAGLAQKEVEIKKLQKLKEPVSSESSYEKPAQRVVSRTAFIVLLVFTIGLATLSAYSLFKGSSSSQVVNAAADSTNIALSGDTATTTGETPVDQKTGEPKPVEQKPVKETKAKNKAPVDSAKSKAGDNNAEKVNTDENTDTDKEEVAKPDKSTPQYKVISKAYFYDEPSEDTRREANINHWNNAVLSALDEKDGFIYVIFTNHLGQTSKGWLRKKDLKRI